MLKNYEYFTIFRLLTFHIHPYFPVIMEFDDYETLPTSSVYTHMIAGAFAGIMEHCVMYPLDSVKVRR